MAMFASPKERSKWPCEKQEMAKALDLEPGWQFLYCFVRTVYQRPVKPRFRKEVSCLAKSKKVDFEPRLQFLHSVSAKPEQQKKVARPLDLEPGLQFLCCPRRTVYQRPAKPRTRISRRKEASGRVKQEMARALDLEPGWQFLYCPV